MRKIPAERMRGETVSPVHTVRLMKTIGVSRAARQLGISTTTLHNARKKKLVSRVIEVAAEGALRSLAGDASSSAPATSPAATSPAASSPATVSSVATLSDDSTNVFILEAAASKRSVIEKFAQAIGARLIAA